MFWVLKPGYLPENNVDFYIDDEAQVPRSFTFCEEEHTEDGLHVSVSGPHVHKTKQPLPPLWYIRKPPFPDFDDLPPYAYQPLNFEKDEVRLLILGPHRGFPDSPIQCQFMTTSLQDNTYCYLAVRNTRGYPFNKATIILDKCSKQITKNLEVFFKDFRDEKRPLLLWIREICINRDDPAERQAHYNEGWIEWVYDHCCRSVDLELYMYNLLDSESIPVDSPPAAGTQEGKYRPMHLQEHYPRHWPIHLGAWRGSDAPPLPHRYLPLDPVSGEIRMIVVLPSSDRDAPLEAHFAHEPLYGDAAYHCLSYTWGSNERSCSMLLNGQIMRITYNLDKALRAFRRKDNQGTITVWADAICIDQENIPEKSRQVPRMHAIYERSDCVVIWLGTRDEDTERAMSLVKNITGEGLGILEEEPNERGFFELKRSPEMARSWASLFRVLQKRYFTRAWVIQEIAASSAPTVFCGDEMCHWDDFHEAALFLLFRFKSVQELWEKFPENAPTSDEVIHTDLSLVHNLAYIRRVTRNGKPLSFLSLAFLTRYADCVDPRDKIYSITNISRDWKDLGIRANYFKSVAQVYIELVKAYVRTHKSLDIICAAQYPSKDNDIPSWCPDWRQNIGVLSFVRNHAVPMKPFKQMDDDELDMDKPIYNASRGMEAIAVDFYFEDTTLVCGGIKADTIAHVVHLREGLKTWYRTALKHLVGVTRPQPGVENPPPLSVEQVDSEFWSAMVGDTTSSFESDFSDAYAQTLMNSTQASGQQQTGPSTSPPKTDESTENDDTMSSIRIRRRPVPDPFPSSNSSSQTSPNEQKPPPRHTHQQTQSRCLIITSQGFLGLASLGVQPGMDLCILIGCSVPVVLAAHENHHHFRGDAYVQGWMRGEVLDTFGGGGMTNEEIFKELTEGKGGGIPFQIK